MAGDDAQHGMAGDDRPPEVAAHEAAEVPRELQMERLVEAVERAQLLERLAGRQLGAVEVRDRIARARHAPARR